MKLTLSVIEADIGSIGGHIQPSALLLETVRGYIAEHGMGLLIDRYISYIGDDIAILSTHERGINDQRVHQLAWHAFMAGTETAKAQGLYGAGQDLLKEAFSGNIRGMGPAVAELEFDERRTEPLLFFAADKTDPGAYNLPLYLAFTDPMNTPGLMLSPDMAARFRFVIMDVAHTEGDRVIELNAPEELWAFNSVQPRREQSRRRPESDVRVYALSGGISGICRAALGRPKRFPTARTSINIMLAAFFAGGNPCDTEAMY